MKAFFSTLAVPLTAGLMLALCVTVPVMVRRYNRLRVQSLTKRP